MCDKVLTGTVEKKGKRKVHGVPQSQAAALPRHPEEEETVKKTKKKKTSTNQTNVRKVFLSLEHVHFIVCI